jgi:lysosomal acid lipase/cholesteryl ester hydrolase
MTREIPLYTLDGVRDAEITTHWVETADRIGISLLRFRRRPARDVVMIIHGLTTSTDMFIQPEHYNLVSYLLDHGFGEVWTLDFRMSNRHAYNLQPTDWSMDDCALFDHPAAIAKIRDVAGGDVAIHVICHCLGSMSFTMALFAGTVTGIRSCIANSVALTPYVPTWSAIKGAIFPFVVERLLQQPYVSPRWSEDPRLTIGKVLSWCVSLFHRECDVPACHMLSLMWGTGWPALYFHENLAEVTHRRGGDLYGAVGLNYHRHVLKMLRHGHRTVKAKPADPRYAALPDDYLAGAARIETPVLLMTGDTNRVFTDSNIHCHRELEARVPGRHELAVFERYGHQDVFMGNRVHEAIFPRLAQFLDHHRMEPEQPVRAVG